MWPNSNTEGCCLVVLPHLSVDWKEGEMGKPPRGQQKGGGGGGGGGGESELHAAARSGDLHAVETICNSNPLAVNSRDRHSRTPLHLAAWSGQTEVVRFLCKNKADIGASAMDDTGAIHFACQKGHLEVVRVLLSSGVSVKVANRKGMTPLHYAVQGTYTELIKYLVRKGANLTAKTKAGQTPLDLASTEDIRSLLKECEQQSVAKDEKSTNCKIDVSEKPEENDEGPISKDEDKNAENNSESREKRKVVDQENSLEPKKPKVSLDHLLGDDDIQEEEET